METGKKHLQGRDFARAILDFANAVRVMPRDAEPHFQLGLAYAGYGDIGDAVQELQKAAEINPKHIGAQLKLAEIMTVNADPRIVKEGKRKAETVLALSPDNPDALQMLASAELRLGEPEDAVQHLEQAIAKVPQHLQSSFTLAMVKLQSNDVAGAEKVMEKAAAEAPRSVEHASALGRLYMLIGKNGEAEAQFRRALTIDPSYGPALTALANLVYRRGNRDEAGQLFARASKLPDKSYRPLHAMFLLETGQSAGAIAEFEQLYKHDRQDRDARTRLIWAYVGAGQNANAWKLLGDVLKQNPKDVDALMQRGELYLAEHKYPEAETDLADVLASRPDSPEAHLVMARIQQAKGAVERQREELSEVLRANPRLLAARLELARLFTASGSPKEAIAVLDQAPEQDRRTLAIVIERNAALYTLGDYAEMRKGVDAGLAVSRQPDLLLEDGLLRIRQRDLKGGRASLEEALKRQPQHWKALEALALSYAAENKLPQATAVVRQYTSQVTNSAAAQQFLGAWLVKTGDLAGARAAFEAERRLAPGSLASVELAELDLRDGKLDSARDTLQAVLTAQPTNLAAKLDLGQAEYRSGHLTEALRYYEQAVQQAPRSIPALNNLAYLLADTGVDPDRALQLAQEVKQLAPNDGTVNDTIGWAYYNKGLYDTAITYLNMKGTMTPRWKSHLALAYLRAGNSEKARAIVQELLKEAPSMPEVKTVLAEMANAR